jgi:D-methionine transport system ATP-binding protein
VEALKDISLAIEPGDIYGIIGMSGAGKSTLVRCLNYLEEPTDGEVLIYGQKLGDMTEKELRAQRSRIAMIFQHFNLLMQKNVLDNVCFPLRIQGVSKAEARKKALELLETVGLSEKAKAYPSQLSGGQKQRVAIARALASNPKILLCDEATSALDPQTTASILELLQQINRDFGITIVIITHQMAVIREICSHVAIIELGSLVEKGEVADIFSHPKSQAARELISRDRPQSAWTDMEGWDGERRQLDRLNERKRIRIVFSENSAFEPVIGNMVLKFGTPVNILRADTKNVGGVAKGEMILGLPDDANMQKEMEQYLLEKGLEIEEVTGDVEQ